MGWSSCACGYVGSWDDLDVLVTMLAGCACGTMLVHGMIWIYLSQCWFRGWSGFTCYIVGSWDNEIIWMCLWLCWFMGWFGSACDSVGSWDDLDVPVTMWLCLFMIWSGCACDNVQQNYETMCTGQEVISESNGFEMEAQLQFVSDGVLAFAYAFKVTLLGDVHL